MSTAHQGVVGGARVPSRLMTRGNSAPSQKPAAAACETPPIGLASSEAPVTPITPPNFSTTVAAGKWRQASVPAPCEAAAIDTKIAADSSWGRSSLRRYAPSLVSLIVHCVVVLVLGVVTFTSPESRGALLTGIFSEENSPLEGQLSTELQAPPEPASEPPSLSLGGGDGLKDALATTNMPFALNGANGNGAGGSGEMDDVLGGAYGRGGGGVELSDIQGKKSANFYGLSAKGNRFVFVIDSSTSMWGPRWIEVRKELIHSIRKLEQDQYFFVICFDVTSLSMFGAESIQTDFASANEENFRKLEYWLSQHTLGPGTKATTSLAEALRLKPDAIFLLTDGEFQDNVLQMLRTNNRNKVKKRKTTVNTIGFHSEIGAPVLGRIATENYGQFRYVAPPPNMPMVQPPMRFRGRVYPPQTMEELTPPRF
jgi:hypothetical protein